MNPPARSRDLAPAFARSRQLVTLDVHFEDHAGLRSGSARVLADAPLFAFGGPRGTDGLEPILSLVAEVLDVDLVLVGHVNGETYTVVAAFARSDAATIDKGAQLPITDTYCREEVVAASPFALGDASASDLYRDHPGFLKHGLRSYVGVPLRLEGGALFGTLCGTDVAPKEFSPEQVERLTLLSGVVSAEISRRLGLKPESEVERALARANASSDAAPEAATVRAARSKALVAGLREAARRQASEVSRLRHHAAELEEFTYTVTHDLQEPLRGIETLAAYLVEEAPTASREDLADTAARVQRNALRLKDRVRGMLEFSRVVRADEQMEEVDVRAVVDDAVAALDHQIREAGATVVLPTAPLPRVTAHRVRVAQVLANLLENALKHNPGRNVRVEIGHRDEGDAHVLWVRDDGGGVPTEFHRRIFDVFQRGPDAAARRGSGVGLAIVKKVAERHGGRAWVESAPGRGATFYFTLAKAPPAAPPVDA